MKFLSAKKLILIGFIVVLLVAIPLTIFVLQQQQQTQTQAEQATTLSFEPVSTSANPVLVQTGDPVSLDVIVDPGVNQNLVSFVRLEIQYDPSKLVPQVATGSASTEAFEVNTAALSLLEGPVISDGTIAATLSVGVDPTKVIQTRTKIATIHFVALASTGDIPTEITFTNTTQVLSAGSSDQANENVLASSQPAYVEISGTDGSITPSPSEQPISTTPSITPSPTTQVTVTVGPSPTGTQSGTVTPPSPTLGSTTGTSTNQAPLCESLTADRVTSGPAPFSLTFNVLGSDPDGMVNQATFSFGDGQVQTLTESEGGGLGTSSINLDVTHSYETPGTYQASVILTDNSGGVSSGTCTLDVTVTDGTTGSTGSSQPTNTPMPDATLPDTGPGDVLIGAGVVISIITIIGGILFFAL